MLLCEKNKRDCEETRTKDEDRCGKHGYSNRTVTQLHITGWKDTNTRSSLTRGPTVTSDGAFRDRSDARDLASLRDQRAR